VITFIAKYYPEDNEFTDKFSLSLASRLRRINVHQVNIFYFKINSLFRKKIFSF
jgi:hypothetical protein